MTKMAVFIAVLLLFASLISGQKSQPAITNSDVVNMMKSGMAEQTILLAIKKGPVKFDTSPSALIGLKSAGVTDQLLNAMLTATQGGVAESASDSNSASGPALLQKAIDDIGAKDKLMAVHSMRRRIKLVMSRANGTWVIEREDIRVYPDKMFLRIEPVSGEPSTEVITPDFSYRTSGKMTTQLSPANLDSVRGQFQFDRINLGQSAQDFSAVFVGEEHQGGVVADELRITGLGRQALWKIDHQSGRLLSSTLQSDSGDVVTEYSDYRQVSGVYFPFKQHLTQSGATTDITVEDLEINPVIDEKIFQRPNEAIDSLSIKVLQSQSVPYVQQSGGGISTSCSISGSSNTTMTANTIGNTTYGNGNTDSNMRMNCNSYDTTIRWPHVLNTMFVQASDGNAYIIACDRAWRWSKCVPLRAGQTFSARMTSKGIEVQAFNDKGKEEEPSYSVLQSKAMR